MLHLNSGTLVIRSAENSQVSLAQPQKRESTDIKQMQGLGILAFFAKPKLTFGAFVIPEVSGGRVAGSQVDFTLVVDRLTRIFDIHAKI